MKIILYKTKPIDECLFNHIKYDFDEHVGLVNEVHGYNADVRYVVERFSDELNAVMKKIPDFYGTHLTYCNPDLFKGKNTFFDEYVFDVVIKNDPNIDNPVVNLVYNNSSILRYNDGNVYFKPIIAGSIIFKESIIRKTILKLNYVLGHELTHAFNDYIVFKKSKGNKRLSDIFPIDKSVAEIRSKDALLRNIGVLFTMINPAEENAKIAQVRQEIENLGSEIFNSRDAAAAIEKTEGYKDFNTANKIIQSLSNIKSNVLQKIVIDKFNELIDGKFTNYNSCLDYAKKELSKFKTRFDKQAAKIAYDVYSDVVSKRGAGYISSERYEELSKAKVE